MDWTLLIEALLLVAAAGIIFAAWMHARLRDRRATRALRASEERFRNLTALSADWFWETDTEHRITWLTGGSTVLAFFGSGLAFGKRLWELPGVELDGVAFTAHLEQLARHAPFFELELSRTHASGSRHVHVVSGQPRYDAAGAFLGYRGVGRDVTERRRGERELAAAKERLELALDGSGGMLWDTDLQTGKVYLSEGWSEFLGLPRAPTATTVDELVRGVHPDDLPRGLKISVDVIKGAPGVLVLSKFAGAARELSAALLTNPYFQDGMALDLVRALEMPLEERVRRHAQLEAAVRRTTALSWADDFLRTLYATDNP
jgi:PAS domain-containing protein